MSFALARALARVPELSIVHMHTGNRLAAQALAVARRRRVPCVISLHGGHFAIPAAEHADLVAGGAARARALDWGRALSWWWGTRSLLERVDAVICVGHEEHQAATARLPRQRVHFLPGAVDVDAFARGDRARGRAALGVDAARELVLAVSRLDRQKDLATLVRAWAAAGRPGCDLALVGSETTPGYADELRSLAAGAAGRLVLPGNIAAAQVPDLLAAADLSVLPSRHEPFGLAIVESWAAGTAVIGAAVGGPAWLLAGETCGRLFAPGDHDALRALIVELLDHPQRRRALAAAGQRRATGEFTWRHHVDRLLAIYAEAGMRVY
ncbi:MAG TPA: glycosyltransferase family 4 protein, partial [Planctomycetota bacterium]|nr:glycosyltransferase family 4 protein [Planctomycetota bacterium]